jgi:hypothetical protein
VTVLDDGLVHSTVSGWPAVTSYVVRPVGMTRLFPPSWAAICCQMSSETTSASARMRAIFIDSDGRLDRWEVQTRAASRNVLCSTESQTAFIVEWRLSDAPSPSHRRTFHRSQPPCPLPSGGPALGYDRGTHPAQSTPYQYPVLRRRYTINSRGRAIVSRDRLGLDDPWDHVRSTYGWSSVGGQLYCLSE